MTRSRAGGRRLTGVAALVAGLAALAAGLGTLTAPVVPPDAGALPAPAAEPVAAAPARPAPRPSARTAVTGVTSVPTGVTIAGLHVSAPVDSVGVTAGGALVVPEDPARVGWWIGSANPGSDRGTVLLAGHVDTAADGPGALFGLAGLPMGAVIEVRAGGTVVRYRAVARRSYHKRRLPADLFTADTAARLVLITCGGDFRHGTYSDNVVLYAVPAT